MSITKLVIIGLLFLFTIGTGIWLSNSGRPLNNILFNIHKLIALISVIYTVVIIRNIIKNMDVKSLIIVLIIFSALFIIALFVTGALLSPGKPANDLLLIIHNISMVLLVISIIAMFYFISNNT